MHSCRSNTENQLDLSRDTQWNIAWALKKSLGLCPRDVHQAQAIFHPISLLSSRYRYSPAVNILSRLCFIFVCYSNWTNLQGAVNKLDGIGPIDNRPSTDKLHHFVQKKKYMWHVTCDTWHMTRDMWHMTRDTWHVTHDTWLVWGGEHSLKISAPLLLPFVIYDIMKIWRKRMNEWMNELMTRMFIEHSRLHRVC